MYCHPKSFPILISLMLVFSLYGQSTQEVTPPDPYKVALGKTLFFDSRLSLDQSVSCHSCHTLIQAPNLKHPSGADSSRFSIGIFGRVGTRNTPTVWNVVERQRLFWDGRADSLEGQMTGPFTDPREMGMPSLKALVDRVKQIPGYLELFKKAFGSRDITFSRMSHAIAAFEKTLVTEHSLVEAFLNGNKEALKGDALLGWERFKRIGCISCHGAPTFSQKDYFQMFPIWNREELNYLYGFNRDKGRFTATGIPFDHHRWRIPSLKNIEITAPYFHNGATDDLETAIRIMGYAQLNRQLSKEDAILIKTFLLNLTGRIPIVSPPRLPE